MNDLNNAPSPPPSSSRVGRRRLVGAAWAAPAVVAAQHAPLASASTACPPAPGFLGLWDGAKLTILVTSNGPDPLPVGGNIVATVVTEDAQTVTLTGQAAVTQDTSGTPPYVTTPSASLPISGQTTWRFVTSTPVQPGLYASLLFTPTAGLQWIVRLSYQAASCPAGPTVCMSSLDLVGNTPGNWCSFPGPS